MIDFNEIKICFLSFYDINNEGEFVENHYFNQSLYLFAINCNFKTC